MKWEVYICNYLASHVNEDFSLFLGQYLGSDHNLDSKSNLSYELTTLL
jgi:hypothetical protein